MVEWSVPAKIDLKKVHEYIAKDSKFYAKKVVNDIVLKSENLNEFPKTGRIVPEIDEPNIREVFIYSYRLIYEVCQDKVLILALLHGKRDFSSGNIDKLRP